MPGQGPGRQGRRRRGVGRERPQRGARRIVIGQQVVQRRPTSRPRLCPKSTVSKASSSASSPNATRSSGDQSTSSVTESSSVTRAWTASPSSVPVQEGAEGLPERDEARAVSEPMHRGALPVGGFFRAGLGVCPLGRRAVQVDGEVVVRCLAQPVFQQLDGLGGVPTGADEVDDLQPYVQVACLVRGERLVDETPLLPAFPAARATAAANVKAVSEGASWSASISLAAS